MSNYEDNDWELYLTVKVEHQVVHSSLAFTHYDWPFAMLAAWEVTLLLQLLKEAPGHAETH